MKTVRKTYIENIKTKVWLDKNVKPTKQSQFIRDANKEKIERVKNKVNL